MTLPYPFYMGPMSCDKKVKMPKEARRAYLVYRTHINKCNNPKVREYQWYGAKGIKVIYSPREFISWWMASIKKKKKWSKPSTSRIDHDHDYCLENIKLEEMSDNAKEPWDRMGLNHGRALSHRRPIIVMVGAAEHIFDSARSAAKFLNFNPATVTRFAQGKISPRDKNISVRYG